MPGTIAAGVGSPFRLHGYAIADCNPNRPAHAHAHTAAGRLAAGYLPR
jgi:hypothetical protein